MFCSYCARSFDVRICNRGHENPRGAAFCTECGSADLSTPAPKPTLLYRFSGWVLYGAVAVLVGTVLLSAVLSLLYTIDWNELSGPLFALLLMLGILYWTTTLLPGPVRKVGRAAGKTLWKSVRGVRGKGRR